MRAFFHGMHAQMSPCQPNKLDTLFTNKALQCVLRGLAHMSLSAFRQSATLDFKTWRPRCCVSDCKAYKVAVWNGHNKRSWRIRWNCALKQVSQNEVHKWASYFATKKTLTHFLENLPQQNGFYLYSWPQTFLYSALKDFVYFDTKILPHVSSIYSFSDTFSDS